MNKILPFFGHSSLNNHQGREFFSLFLNIKTIGGGFPGGAVVENLPANAGDTGSNPGLGRSHMPWSN